MRVGHFPRGAPSAEGAHSWPVGTVELAVDGLHMRRFGRPRTIGWHDLRGARRDREFGFVRRIVLVHADGTERHLPGVVGWNVNHAAELGRLANSITERSTAPDPVVEPMRIDSARLPIVVETSRRTKRIVRGVVLGALLGTLALAVVLDVSWIAEIVGLAGVLVMGWSVERRRLSAEPGGVRVGSEWWSWNEVVGFVTPTGKGRPFMLIGRTESVPLSLWWPGRRASATRRDQWRRTVAQLEFLRRSYSK